MDNKIIVLCGKSGAGKDSLANILKNRDYNFITSTTTRPTRKGESERKPYYFVSEDYFKKLINNDKLIEYRVYKPDLGDGKSYTWYYGVEGKEIKEDLKYVVVLDLLGLKDFKNKFKNRVISFYVDVDDETRQNRVKNRGSFIESEWNRRLRADSEDFSESKINEVVDYRVENYDISECLYQILNKIVRPTVEEMEL